MIKGYAVKIMEHAIRKAKQDGARRVILYTNSRPVTETDMDQENLLLRVKT